MPNAKLTKVIHCKAECTQGDRRVLKSVPERRNLLTRTSGGRVRHVTLTKNAIVTFGNQEYDGALLAETRFAVHPTQKSKTASGCQ